MAKVSELSDGQLSQSLNKYEQLLLEDAENEKYAKILKAIKSEQKKRTSSKSVTGELSSETVSKSNDKPIKQKSGKVQKFHSSDLDFHSMEDAKFLPRAIALIIDGFFVGIASQILTAIISAGISSKILNPILGGGLILLLSMLIIPFAYYIVPVKNTGQTFGKKLMKIKVITRERNGELTLGRVMKREWLGKLVSSFFFLVGYIVFLFDKPTWHDNIAETRVVKID